MFVYLSKKISVPNNSRIHAIAWDQDEGFIVAGGEDGLLKVLKLETVNHSNGKSNAKGLATLCNLSINQSLEGHSGVVQVIAWNECHRKLTTSDSQGLVIVWMAYKGSWYEEMINNRNKSIVVDMAWSPDGSKIAIVYQDGNVIIGSVNGNRIWNKDILGSNLNAVAWSPDCHILLFGKTDGEVHAYDTDGNFLSKLAIACLNNAELKSESPTINWTIVDLIWYSPTLVDNSNVKTSPRSKFLIPISGMTENRPRLAIVYRHEIIQMMRTENDIEPTIIRMEHMIMVNARWSPDGHLLAISGQQTDFNPGEQNVVYFITAYGQKLRMLKMPGKQMSGCSWEATGLRVSLAVDSQIYIANIRPDYKWGYCGQTVVYSYARPYGDEYCVVFYNVRLEELYVKCLHYLMAITAFGDYCTLINRVDDPCGMYLLQLCNGIGTPVDFKFVDIEPHLVTMNTSEVLIADQDTFYLWHYAIPSRNLGDGKFGRAGGSTPEKIWHINDENSADTEINKGRESGTVHRYSLPDVGLQCKYSIHYRPSQMALNLSGSRLAVIDHLGMLHLFDLTADIAHMIVGFERKDVWNMCWNSENDCMLAIMEKTRMFVLRDTEAEEPVVTSGYLCCFRDLTVRTVLLDELVLDPENANAQFIVDIEIKSLRDAKSLLEKMNIREASAFIEKNSHPKLWSQLAQVSLSHKDATTAEHAFVMLKDFGGVQFVNRLNGIHNEMLKKAEIAAYFGRYDDAELIYMENDRRDLALKMRQKLNDWFRILQILQTNASPGDDQLLHQAWNNVGDYFADRRKWPIAAKHYESGQNYEQLARCYLMMEDYAKLEQLMQQLPDNHELLPAIGEMFANSGLCNQAVESYVKMADDEKNRHCQLLRLKKLYVLGALLIEQYHEQNKVDAVENRSTSDRKRMHAQAALSGLLTEDQSVSVVDSKLIDGAWRGAEACHFYMLAQSQLYEGNVEVAMKTALHLCDYDDIVDPLEIFSLLALSSCAARQFSVCSRAFIKLESIDGMADEQRMAYQKLALDIFTRNSPKDSHSKKTECTGCETLIADYCQSCPSCDLKFPTCIVTGRPLMEYQFWLCPVCKHQAYQIHIQNCIFCPLCHASI